MSSLINSNLTSHQSDDDFDASSQFVIVRKNALTSQLPTLKAVESTERKSIPRTLFMEESPDQGAGRLPYFRGRNSETELKSATLAQGTYGFDSSGTITTLNLVAQGLDVVNRLGRAVTLRSLELFGNVVPQGSTVAPSACRLILLYDKYPTGSLLTYADIFTAATGASTYVNDFILFGNLPRFKILLDETYAMAGHDSTGPSGGDPSIRHLHRTFQFKKGLPMTYRTTGASISDVLLGTLYMITIGGGTASTSYNFNGQTRVRFTDA